MSWTTTPRVDADPGPLARLAVFLERVPWWAADAGMLASLWGVMYAAGRQTETWRAATLAVVYGAVAAVWLARQFVHSLDLDGPMPRPRLRLLVPGLVVSLVVFLVDLTWAKSGYFTVGAGTILVVLMGYVQLWLRDEARGGRRGRPAPHAVAELVRRWLRRPELWVGAGAAAVVIGFTLLGRFDVRGVEVGGVLLGLGLLAAALGAGVCADRRTEQLEGDDRARLRARLRGRGAGTLLGAAALGALILQTWWALILFAALAVVTAAIVGRVLADVVLVLGLVGFMGFTPAAEEEPSYLTSRSGPDVLVVLGDSYISGEGAHVYFEGTDGQEGEAGKEPNECRRAPSSWAVEAGREHFKGGVVFLACSGARSYNVGRPQADLADEKDYAGWVGPLPEPQSGNDLTQLQQYDRLKTDAWSPRMVVMSLGGNDSGFSTVGLMCLAPGDCQDKSNLWFKSLNTVETQLDQAFAEVRSTFGDHVPVLVTAYPDPILDSDRRECDDVALSYGDREFIEDFGAALNARIYRVATKHRFYFLGAMEEALADGKKLCDPEAPEGPGINFVGLRSTSGAVEQRFNPAKWTHNSLHPDETGHDAMREVFEDWWNDHTSEGQPTPAGLAPADPEADARYEAIAALWGSPGRPGEQGDGTRPPCTLLAGDDNQPNCRSAGTSWALQQVSATVLAHGWGILVGLALLGAWLLAVSLTAGITGQVVRRLAASQDAGSIETISEAGSSDRT